MRSIPQSRRRVLISGGLGYNPVYDGASVIYTLRRPAMTTLWTNAVLKIRRSSDNATAFVFFDGSSVDNTISTNSLISTSSNTTPSATTLGTWVGANDAFVEEWIGVTDDNTIDSNKTASQTTTSLQPQFISGGSILTKGGLPEVRFASDKLVASANSDISNPNSYTVFTVANSSGGDTQGVIFSTQTAAVSSRFTVHNTRSTSRLNVVWRSTANNLLLYAANQTSTNTRLQTVTYDNVTGYNYLNGSSQNSVSINQNYPNVAFQIGVQQVSTNYLTGGIQEIIIFPSDKTADLTDLHNEINTYYSIY